MKLSATCFQSGSWACKGIWSRRYT